MNIYEYIENSQISYPFMSDSFLNTTVDNPTSTADFQELLKNYIYENFGIYQISPLIVMRENSTEKSFDDIISEISTLVYKANEYRYIGTEHIINFFASFLSFRQHIGDIEK